MDGGERVNTSGGIVHFTGIAWAGELGEEVADEEPHEVGFASGACLAVPTATWNELGGMPDDYFLYHEDVEFSLRVRLGGGKVGVEPAARADHDYDFHKGALKWRMLEGNRWAAVLGPYPTGLFVVVGPALGAVELAVVAG